MFQFGEEDGPVLSGSSAAHDGSAAKGLLLAHRHRSVPIGPEFRSREGGRVLQVSVEGQNQGGTFLDESNPSMLSAVDPPRMPFGLTEPTFQVEIVCGQIEGLAAGEQTGLKTGHQPGHVAVDRIGTPLQPLLQRGELRFAWDTSGAGRLQRRRYGPDIVHVLFDLGEGFCDLG